LTSLAQGKRGAIAALPNDTTQVVMIGTDDTAYHRVRDTGGTWTVFGPLQGTGTTTAKNSAGAIAGLPDGSSSPGRAAGCTTASARERLVVGVPSARRIRHQHTRSGEGRHRRRATRAPRAKS